MYINISNNNTKETIDTINREDFKDSRDFQKELKRVLNEYKLAFKSNNIYSSTRIIS